MGNNEKENVEPENEEESQAQLEEQKKLSRRIDKLSRDMENFNIAEYMNMLNNPRRYLKVNFMAGVARGVGFALGAILLAALAIYFLQLIITMNLPLISDFIAELVEIVQEHL